MRGAEGRPGQEAHQQFKAGLPGYSSGEKRGSDQAFSVDKPVDLVGNIRSMIQQERARRTEHFNPAWWLRGKIGVIFGEAVEQQQPRAKQAFFYGLRAAWDLVAYEQIDGENNSSAYHDINGCTHVFRSTTLQLSPLGVTLLDAMAEALDMPDHTPGQAQFDISLFSDQERWEKIESKAASINPTADEVKRAISTSMDAEK